MCENDGVKIMSGLCECPHWEHTDSLEPNEKEKEAEEEWGVGGIDMASVWGLASTSVTFLTANNRGCEADQWESQ